MSRVLIAATVLAGAMVQAQQPAPQPGNEVTLGEALVIPPVGRYGRSPVHEDAIESLVVAGKWTRPQAGDAITMSDGSKRQWQPAQAAADGTLKHPALGGGYAYFAVRAEDVLGQPRAVPDSPAGRVMLLEAAGHGMVYVNGEPRTGDPYQNGYVRLPVLLWPGTNDFLFHVGRGSLRAKLVSPKAAAQLDTQDATLPDLIVGEKVDAWAAVVVINATNELADGLGLEVTLPGAEPVVTWLPRLLPLGTRKVGLRLEVPAPESEGTCEMQLRLLRKSDDAPETLDTGKVTLRVLRPEQTHKRTFVSEIDGSVQYFAVVPQKKGDRDTDELFKGSRLRPNPALILTLHGAGVEAIGQADAYLQKDWAHVVAPTNRRPFGFDWEDWGRLDAIEVLELAQRQLRTSPGRTYLTGHSMGGHGVWQIGAHFADRFAAIGPSAGWVSMYSYAGAPRSEPPNAVQELLLRSASASDTLVLARNYAQHGVYILHGEKDDNVPADQARTMRRVLDGFHKDFIYHEEPGMGHWWGKEGIAGTACVDWPPMWDFFRKHSNHPRETVRDIEFVTVSPGVSAWSHWVGIEAQTRQFAPSSVRIYYNLARQRFSATTDNVARLVMDVSHLEKGRTFWFELDSQELPAVKLQEHQDRIWLTHEAGQWSVAAQPPPSRKGPHRYGPFKEAFRNRLLFVYGTQGTPEENAWALAKARYDAESFWYRGNASIDVLADLTFDPGQAPDRNVILYGNAHTNSAWRPLLADSPVQVQRSRVQIGDRVELGDDLACLFVRPRPGSDRALVGVVSGTGGTGMRLADRMPYFVSGVAYPDCTVVDSEMLTKGTAGVHVAGFFGIDWGVAEGEFVWRD